jgi:hypothetical protein
MHLFTFPEAVIGFSTRLDGDLNLIDASPAARELAWQALQLPFAAELPRFCQQIHENSCREVTAQSPIGSQGQADALCTTQRGKPIGVFTADCLPVIIKAHGVIAAVHAGWKSTRLNIVGSVIQRLCTSHSLLPADLELFMGPCIGSCCLELGDEVPPTFLQRHVAYQAAFSRGQKWHLDLRGLNVMQAMASGVPLTRIRHVNDCTKCKNDSYFSYRAQKGRHGSLFSFVVLL